MQSILFLQLLHLITPSCGKIKVRPKIRHSYSSLDPGFAVGRLICSVCFSMEAQWRILVLNLQKQEHSYFSV